MRQNNSDHQKSNQETLRNEANSDDYSNPNSRRTHVRFTRSEYCQIFRKGLETGKSIQTLLKDAYAAGDIAKAKLNPKESEAAVNAIKAIGEKINSIIQRVNGWITSNVKDEITEALNDCRTLKSF